MVVACIDFLGPSTLEFGAETDTGSKPLTNGNIETERGAINTERVLVAALFLRGVSSSRLNTCTYEPVCPERVCSNAVLLGRSNSVLCHSTCGKTNKCKRNH